ncbi:DUF2291 family protein [Frigidibacter sp. ROC022]|uniref:DUF2291 family protein n=1 Tax=Frigidibacter sp. ROC022 TaxID=2971796 RepID=UPI00215A55B9|nr:DUF2291 domain-containing protein [Frigidibacter sp. ROC022]MCR8726137.1 DUF2291 domain-containing protein [Frigidibacter sp. ROC022]
MIRTLVLSICLAATLTGLSACKIVKNDTGAEGAIPPGPEGDAARIAALLEETYEARLVPHVTDTATDISALRSALAGGLDAAGEAHGVRATGEGSAWSFAVKGSGTVVEQNRKSRAATLGLDTDADGKPDTTLQLGPVVKGTALRDVAPFYVFTDFRDQIEFARLARALNDRAVGDLSLPEGDLTGRSVTFLGAFAARSASDPILVVPLSIEVSP